MSSTKKRSSSKEVKDKEKTEKHSSKDKEKKRSKKEKEKQKKREPTPEPEPEVYEDDFEDYEDDFEEEDEEIETEKKNVENVPEKQDIAVEYSSKDDKQPNFESEIARRLSKSHLINVPRQITTQKSSKPQEKPTTTTNSQGGLTLIDNKPYHNYNEEERKSSEQRSYERFQKLRGLISIEISKTAVITDLSSNIFEPFQVLPNNLTHAFTQTGSDNKSEEVQTEIKETEIKETQFPHIESSFNNSFENEKEKTSADRARFKKFFIAATQTIREILINEGSTAEEEETREKTSMQFSRGYNSFALGAVAQNSKASCITKGEADSVIVAFEIFESPAQDLANKSLIVEFYIHKRRGPKRLFVVESIVSAMKLSTSSQTFYVCLKDGTLCAFDLTATDANFEDTLPWVDSETDIALRRPSFDSSFLATTISDASPLVGLEVVKTQSGEEVTTIDASGTISYWNSNRVEQTTNEINVQLAAIIRPHPILKRHSPSFTISSFCSISKPVRFLIGTDTGILYSVYKSDTSQAMPKIFRTEKGSHWPQFFSTTIVTAEKYGEVTSIDSSPFDSTVLAVGFSSGAIAIYRTSQTSPVLHLPKGDTTTRVTNVMWSLSNSSALFAIHGGSVIVYWDLSHSLSPRSIDHRQEIGNIVNSKIWTNEGSSMVYMGFALDTGSSEVHMLETPSRKNINESLVEVLNRLRNI